jgi:hypothetical protein
MDRRSFLMATTLAAAGTVAPKVGHAAASKTYVLVHGAGHGGWCWSKVASICADAVTRETDANRARRALAFAVKVD